MNRWLRTGAAALLALAVAFPAFAFARVAIDVKATDSPVKFSHARHAGSDCRVCHDAKPTATPPAFSVQLTSSLSCQKCHDLNEDEAPPTEGCTNCHNDISPE